MCIKIPYYLDVDGGHLSVYQKIIHMKMQETWNFELENSYSKLQALEQSKIHLCVIRKQPLIFGGF